MLIYLIRNIVTSLEKKKLYILLDVRSTCVEQKYVNVKEKKKIKYNKKKKKIRKKLTSGNFRSARSHKMLQTKKSDAAFTFR